MKILVVGSRGQLGTELIAILKEGKSSLVAPEVFKNNLTTGINSDDLDISDVKAVNEYFKCRSFDLIINCAAITAVDLCENDPGPAMKANAIGAGNLAYAASSIKCPLIHISTDYVFDGKTTTPYQEWDLCNPQTVYGKSKLLGERYVRGNCRESFIVRTSWLYGYSGNNFVKTIIKTAKEKGILKVVNDQLGSPTSANELAHHILKLAATDYYGIYHCAGNGFCTWYDFACEIIRLGGIKCEISPCSTEEFPKPAPRPAYSVLDNLALRCTVGDEMNHWREALARFMKSVEI